jgi:membrane protease YdiL (CAAX protease family)
VNSLSDLAVSWNAQDAVLAVLLGVTVVGYVLYHFGAQALSRRAPGEQVSVVRGRLLGALVLGAPGLVVAALWSPDLLGLWRLPSPAAWGVVGGALALLLPILWLAAGGEAHREHYPQIRAERWTRRLVLIEGLTWGAYLVAYEWAFRGLLVCALASVIGVWPALLLGTGLYVLAHLEKGLGECLACVPMGLAFGVLAWWSQSLWAPIALHLGLALAGNLFAVARDPGRRFVWRETAPSGCLTA